MPKFKNGDVVTVEGRAARMVVIDHDAEEGRVRCIPLSGSGLEPRVYAYYGWTLEGDYYDGEGDALPVGAKVRDDEGSTWTKRPQGWTIVGTQHWALTNIAGTYGPLTLVPTEESEPVTPKVGDRVLIKGVPGAFSHLNGSRGVVTALVSRPKYSHEVEVDGRPGRRLLFATSELELIQEEEGPNSPDVVTLDPADPFEAKVGKLILLRRTATTEFVEGVRQFLEGK